MSISKGKLLLATIITSLLQIHMSVQEFVIEDEVMVRVRAKRFPP